MKVADQVIVLADSTKFGGGYLSVICPLNEIDQIITDGEVEEEYISRARQEEIPLVIA